MLPALRVVIGGTQIVVSLHGLAIVLGVGAGAVLAVRRARKPAPVLVAATRACMGVSPDFTMYSSSRCSKYPWKRWGGPSGRARTLPKATKATISAEAAAFLAVALGDIDDWSELTALRKVLREAAAYEGGKQ